MGKDVEVVYQKGRDGTEGEEGKNQENIIAEERRIPRVFDREMEEFKRMGSATPSNVVMPKYQRDEILDVDREYGKPPESAFIGLGWDVDATTKRKHYRRFFADELENIKEGLELVSPFATYVIKRG